MAHGIDIEITLASPAVIARAGYADGEPISYAQVLIFAQGEEKIEHQNGRTDATGRFAFVPDRAGEWRFIVDDELGHKAEKKIEITEGFFSGSDRQVLTSEGPGMFFRWLMGISLIIGVTGIFAWIKARQRLKRE